MVTVLCASRNNHIFRLALGDFNYTFIKRQRQTKKNKLNKEGRAHKQIRCREKSTEQFPELTTRRWENIQKKVSKDLRPSRPCKITLKFNEEITNNSKLAFEELNI